MGGDRGRKFEWGLTGVGDLSEVDRGRKFGWGLTGVEDLSGIAPLPACCPISPPTTSPSPTPSLQSHARHPSHLIPHPLPLPHPHPHPSPAPTPTPSPSPSPSPSPRSIKHCDMDETHEDIVFGKRLGALYTLRRKSDKDKGEWKALEVFPPMFTDKDGKQKPHPRYLRGVEGSKQHKM